MGGKCWGGWSFFFVRDLEISPAGRSSIAAQRDFYLSALASEYDLRAWHFAVLLSIALACSFGCGPSSVLCKNASKLLVFPFRRKTTKILFLRTFSRKRRRHGMAARLRNNCIVATFEDDVLIHGSSDKNDDLTIIFFLSRTTGHSRKSRMTMLLLRMITNTVLVQHHLSFVTVDGRTRLRRAVQ